MSESATAPDPTTDVAPGTAQRLAAEAIGTFVLVLFGVGTVLMSGWDYVATALAFGFAVLVVVTAFGRVSGGHFNPAVSLGAAVSGRISWRDASLYSGVQVAGGVAGGLTLWVIMQGFPGFDSRAGFGQNSFGDAGSGLAWWGAFLIELLLTAVFLGVILAVTDTRHAQVALAPLTIGLTLAAIHFASIGATGTSVNPARSIAANIFAGSEAVSQLWLFILAPLLGGALAGVTYPLVFGHGADPVPGSGLRRRAGRGVTGDGTEESYPQQWNHNPGAGRSPAGAAYPPEGWQHEQPPAPPAPWETPAAWGPVAEPPPVTKQPWSPSPQELPPPPNEPYWSQQLPQWGSPTDGEGEEDGRTQIRPPEGT
jgi:aquaporin Z